MGKNLIAQRRGKGSSTFRAPSFRYIGTVAHRAAGAPVKGKIVELIHSQGHCAPIARIIFDDGVEGLVMAPLGVRTGDEIAMGDEVEVRAGNTMPVRNIPEGTFIYNIESQPGDGGKFVRAGGTTAKIAARFGDRVLIELPSKKQREFNPGCRATIGVIAGGGRTEKPLLKAGNHYHKMRARNKMYPHVSAMSMNAVDHPFGGSRSSKLGKSAIAPRFAPPGRKVGKIRPRRTGRRTR